MGFEVGQFGSGRMRNASVSRHGGDVDNSLNGRKSEASEEAIGFSERHPFVTRLAKYTPLGKTDIDGIGKATERTLDIPRKRDIVLEGYKCRTLHLVERGFGIRCKLLPNGKRQILGLVLVGDIVGLPGAVFNRAAYSVASLTPMLLYAIPLRTFVELCEARPAVAVAMV